MVEALADLFSGGGPMGIEFLHEEPFHDFLRGLDPAVCIPSEEEVREAMAKRPQKPKPKRGRRKKEPVE
jgi:hypothetical protein